MLIHCALIVQGGSTEPTVEDPSPGLFRLGSGAWLWKDPGSVTLPTGGGPGPDPDGKPIEKGFTRIYKATYSKATDPQVQPKTTFIDRALTLAGYFLSLIPFGWATILCYMHHPRAQAHVERRVPHLGVQNRKQHTA